MIESYFRRVKDVIVLGDHTPTAENPRHGCGQGTPVGIVRETDPASGSPSKMSQGFFYKNNWIPIKYRKTQSGQAPTQEQLDEPIAFGVALVAQGTEGARGPDTDPSRVTITDNFTTQITRPATDTTSQTIEDVGQLTDAIHVVDAAAVVVIQDTDKKAGQVAAFPSKGSTSGKDGVKVAKWVDLLDFLSNTYSGTSSSDVRDLLGLRGLHLLGDPANPGRGYVWSLGGKYRPASSRAEGAEILEGWIDVNGGAWRPYVSYVPKVPRDPKDGKDGGPGPQGPAGPAGPAGGGGNPPPPPLPPKNGVPSDPIEDPGEGFTHTDESLEQAELTPCDQPVKKVGGGSGHGDGDQYEPFYDEDGNPVADPVTGRRYKDPAHPEEGFKDDGDNFTESDTPGKRNRPKEGPGSTTTPSAPKGVPTGSIYARMHPAAGKTAIQPKFPKSYNPKGDQRQLLGGGIFAPGAPSVPRAGIRQFDKFDFVYDVHSPTDVDNGIINKVNQIIAFINERFEGGPNKIANGGLHLPAQDLTKFRFDAFREGSIVVGDSKIGRVTYKLLHQIVKDREGKSILAPLTNDHMPERWLGDEYNDTTIGIREDRVPEAGRARIVFSRKDRAFVIKRADFEVQGELTVSGEDSSYNKHVTGDNGVLTITAVDSATGTEYARTLAKRSGGIALAPSALTSGLLVQADVNGDLVPAGSGGSLGHAGLKFSNGTINRTLNAASFTLDSLADNLYTLCYDLATTGYASGWTLSGSTDPTLDCSAITANQLAKVVNYIAADLVAGGSFIPSDYTVSNRQHVFYLDCDSYTLNQLGYAIAALLKFLGA